MQRQQIPPDIRAKAKQDWIDALHRHTGKSVAQLEDVADKMESGVYAKAANVVDYQNKTRERIQGAIAKLVSNGHRPGVSAAGSNHYGSQAPMHPGQQQQQHMGMGGMQQPPMNHMRQPQPQQHMGHMSQQHMGQQHMGQQQMHGNSMMNTRQNPYPNQMMMGGMGGHTGMGNHMQQQQQQPPPMQQPPKHPSSMAQSQGNMNMHRTSSMGDNANASNIQMEFPDIADMFRDAFLAPVPEQTMAHAQAKQQQAQPTMGMQGMGAMGPPGGYGGMQQQQQQQGYGNAGMGGMDRMQPPQAQQMGGMQSNPYASMPGQQSAAANMLGGLPMQPMQDGPGLMHTGGSGPMGMQPPGGIGAGVRSMPAPQPPPQPPPAMPAAGVGQAGRGMAPPPVAGTGTHMQQQWPSQYPGGTGNTVNPQAGWQAPGTMTNNTATAAGAGRGGMPPPGTGGQGAHMQMQPQSAAQMKQDDDVTQAFWALHTEMRDKYLNQLVEYQSRYERALRKGSAHPAADPSTVAKNTMRLELFKQMIAMLNGQRNAPQAPAANLTNLKQLQHWKLNVCKLLDEVQLQNRNKQASAVPGQPQQQQPPLAPTPPMPSSATQQQVDPKLTAANAFASAAGVRQPGQMQPMLQPSPPIPPTPPLAPTPNSLPPAAPPPAPMSAPQLRPSPQLPPPTANPALPLPGSLNQPIGSIPQSTDSHPITIDLTGHPSAQQSLPTSLNTAPAVPRQGSGPTPAPAPGAMAIPALHPPADMLAHVLQQLSGGGPRGAGSAAAVNRRMAALGSMLPAGGQDVTPPLPAWLVSVGSTGEDGVKHEAGHVLIPGGDAYQAALPSPPPVMSQCSYVCHVDRRVPEAQDVMAPPILVPVPGDADQLAVALSNGDAGEASDECEEDYLDLDLVGGGVSGWLSCGLEAVYKEESRGGAPQAKRRRVELDVGEVQTLCRAAVLPRCTITWPGQRSPLGYAYTQLMIEPQESAQGATETAPAWQRLQVSVPTLALRDLLTEGRAAVGGGGEDVAGGGLSALPCVPVFASWDVAYDDPKGQAAKAAFQASVAALSYGLQPIQSDGDGAWGTAGRQITVGQAAEKWQQAVQGVMSAVRSAASNATGPSRGGGGNAAATPPVMAVG